MNKVIWFIKDYLSRHKHPVDAVLHIIGVPQVFFGIYQLIKGEWRWGIFNFCFGYFLQWVGHRFFEKNEVGEVILIKAIVNRLRGNKR